jgi:hypothetical protein
MCGLRLKTGSTWAWDEETRDSNLDAIETLGAAFGKSRDLRTLDLSDCELGAKALGALSRAVDWDISEVIWLSLAGNVIGGAIKRGMGVYANYKVDKDLSGLTQFAKMLEFSTIEYLDLSRCQLGSEAMHVMASSTEWDATRLTVLNVLSNPIEDEGLGLLLERLEDVNCSLQSICGIQLDQTAADFSARQLRPMDMKIICADIATRRASSGAQEHPTSNFNSPCIVSLDVSDNPGIVGMIEHERLMQPDEHLEDWVGTCATLCSAGLRSLSIENIGMGMQALQILSRCMRSKFSQLSVARNSFSKADECRFFREFSEHSEQSASPSKKRLIAAKTYSTASFAN